MQTVVKAVGLGERGEKTGLTAPCTEDLDNRELFFMRFPLKEQVHEGPMNILSQFAFDSLRKEMERQIRSFDIAFFFKINVITFHNFTCFWLNWSLILFPRLKENKNDQHKNRLIFFHLEVIHSGLPWWHSG